MLAGVSRQKSWFGLEPVHVDGGGYEDDRSVYLMAEKPSCLTRQVHVGQVDSRSTDGSNGSSSRPGMLDKVLSCVSMRHVD